MIYKREFRWAQDKKKLPYYIYWQVTGWYLFGFIPIYVKMQRERDDEHDL